ncbi:MAG: hypothetical protein JWO08_942 [Verrucomicrobiaceae bacterium]|nr:hypothetical protein [Verrucomicrobiaceae bacterium]
MNSSTTMLLLACAVLTLVELLRPTAEEHLKTILAGAFGATAASLLVAGVLCPTGASYPTAENYRVVKAAKETAISDAAAADCAVIVDGSSVFSYAVDLPTLKAELTAEGYHPCLLSLKLLGGEHIEREWMARQLRQSLPKATRDQLDRLPMLWVKELHWTYESHPARFVASNADSASMLALCEPAVSLQMVSALHSNWWQECNYDHLRRCESLQRYPLGQNSQAVRQGLFNAFHTGQIQRATELASPPLYDVLGPPPLVPLSGPRPWWAQHPAADSVMKPSSRFAERHWFAQLLKQAPSSWPQHPGFKLVLATAYGQNQTVRAYTATLATSKQYGSPLVLAGEDETLRPQLDVEMFWRDSLHMEHAGSLIYTRWLARQLQPFLAQLRASYQEREVER